MEDKKVLIDTSILVEFFRKRDKSKSIFWSIVDKFDCSISAVTLFEMYSGATDEQKMKELDIVLDWLTVLDFNSSCAKAASVIFKELRRKNRIIESRDLFIAGTAITLDIPVATINLKHFQYIPNIRLFAR